LDKYIFEEKLHYFEAQCIAQMNELICKKKLKFTHGIAIPVLKGLFGMIKKK
jgi:hypothetical protein